MGTLRPTLLIDVLTAAIGIGILCFVRIPWQKPQRMGQQEKVSVFADMKTGIHYAFGDKIIGRILVVRCLAPGEVFRTE